MELCKECGIAPVCGSIDLSFRLESSLQVNDAVLFVERTVTVILNYLHHCKKLIQRFSNDGNVDHLRQKKKMNERMM